MLTRLITLAMILSLGTSAQGDDRIRLRNGGEIAGSVVNQEKLEDDQLLTISLASGGSIQILRSHIGQIETCLLYTSDAADEE